MVQDEKNHEKILTDARVLQTEKTPVEIIKVRMRPVRGPVCSRRCHISSCSSRLVTRLLLPCRGLGLHGKGWDARRQAGRAGGRLADPCPPGNLLYRRCTPALCTQPTFRTVPLA